LDEYRSDGNFVYELYAVMNHQGNAHGGHYYGYIKDFESGKWFNFNDTTVREISILDIIKLFGVEKPNKGQKRTFTSGQDANAYMLFYRIIEEDNL
jgi:uncharacterized UBP type Zn finger protein